MYRKILVANDGSNRALKALTAGFELASSYNAECSRQSRISSTRVKAKAHKAAESNGLIWVYMGARREAR
jgi:hypothetical protein